MKRKLICWLSVLTILLTTVLPALTVGASAETYSGTCGGEGDGSNLTWTLDTVTGKLVIEGSGKMGSYRLSSNNTAPWYSHRENVKSITINEGVTNIGENAFSDCDDLTSIEIPNSVTGIDLYAFGSCSNLKSIEIPSSVTSIGSSAFQGCDSLTSIEIPSSVTSIGIFAFHSCDSLTSVSFGANSQLSCLGSNSFRDCSNLTSIEIPSSVTRIESQTFYSCYNLTSVSFGANSQLIHIGDGAFEYCSSLTSIEIPSSVTNIGDSTFKFCSNLANIHYLGTQNEWKQVNKGSEWYPENTEITTESSMNIPALIVVLIVASVVLGAAFSCWFVYRNVSKSLGMADKKDKE